MVKTMSSRIPTREEGPQRVLLVVAVNDKKKMGLSFWIIWSPNLGH